MPLSEGMTTSLFQLSSSLLRAPRWACLHWETLLQWHTPVPAHPEGELWGFLIKGSIHTELNETDSERKTSKRNVFGFFFKPALTEGKYWQKRLLRQKRQSKKEVIIRNRVAQSFLSSSRNKCMVSSLPDCFRERTVAQQTTLPFAYGSPRH